MINLTKRDISDLTEGLKKRPIYRWKKSSRKTSYQRLIDILVDKRGEVNITELAKKYDKTSIEILEIINKLGLY